MLLNNSMIIIIKTCVILINSACFMFYVSDPMNPIPSDRFFLREVTASEQARIPGDEDAGAEQLRDAGRPGELVVVPHRRQQPRDLPLRRQAFQAHRLVEARRVHRLLRLLAAFSIQVISHEL